jgi:hypothetical protein
MPVRNQRPETRIQNPETRNQRPETRDQRPDRRPLCSKTGDVIQPWCGEALFSGFWILDSGFWSLLFVSNLGFEI